MKITESLFLQQSFLLRIVDENTYNYGGHSCAGPVVPVESCVAGQLDRSGYSDMYDSGGLGGSQGGHVFRDGSLVDDRRFAFRHVFGDADAHPYHQTIFRSA